MEGFVDPNAPSPMETPMENIKGAGVAAVQPDPLNAASQAASPEEQQAYDDLIKRAVAMIHDFRGGNNVADNIVKALSNDKNPAWQTIGQQTGNIIKLLYENAKRQGVKYPGEVIQNVGLDVVVELVDLARETGAIKDLPEPGSAEDDEFHKLASIEAAKFFGDYLQQTGQANPEEYQAVMDEQMKREASAGELDDWNMEGLPQEFIDQGMAQTGGFTDG